MDAPELRKAARLLRDSSIISINQYIALCNDIAEKDRKAKRARDGKLLYDCYVATRNDESIYFSWDLLPDEELQSWINTAAEFLGKTKP